MKSRLQKWLSKTLTSHDSDEGSAEQPAPAPDSDRFRDDGLLGRGATSVVRRVFDRVLSRHTALKVLGSQSPAARARFLDEARLTARLQHPYVPAIHDWGTDEEGHDYMNLEEVTGQTLKQRLKDLGDARLEPANLDALLTVVVKVCEALSYAHSLDVVHRDLKPSNVMLGSFGQVYLLDWGIASAPGSRDGEHRVAGTPGYMAPEQVVDGEVDARTDVHALGALLYFILTGRPPYRGTNPSHTMSLTVGGRVTPPEEVAPHLHVSGPLSAIALRALRTDRAERHPSAQAFQADIEAFVRGGWQLPTRTVPADTPIVEEGAPGDEAYLILRGRCSVATAARGVVRELGPGDVFGEMAVLADRPRSSTVRALTEVAVQVVSRQALQEALAMDSWSGRFVRALADRFAESEAASDQA